MTDKPCCKCKYMIRRATRYYNGSEARCENPDLLQKHDCAIDVIDGGYVNNRCNEFRDQHGEDCQFFCATVSASFKEKLRALFF